MASFAYVRFSMDNVKDIVPVSDIKHFEPQSITDFEATKMYLVKWRISEDDLDPDYYKAQILMLDATREKIKQRIDSTRVRIPKVLDTSVEDSSSEEESLSRILEKEKKEKKKEKSNAKLTSLKAILQKSVEERKKKPLFPSPPSKDECSGCKRKHAELQTLKHQLEECEQKATREVEKYKVLNMKLQETLLNKLSEWNREPRRKLFKDSDESSPTSSALWSSPSPRSPPVVSEESSGTESACNEAGLYHVEDGKINLGGSINMLCDKWNIIKTQKRHSMFVKNFVTAVWGTEQLKNRSINGSRCPRFGDREAKPALTPEKLNAIEARFMDRLEKQGHSALEKKYEQDRFKKYITEKLQDVNRKKSN